MANEHCIDCTDPCSLCSIPIPPEVVRAALATAGIRVDAEVSRGDLIKGRSQAYDEMRRATTALRLATNSLLTFVDCLLSVEGAPLARVILCGQEYDQARARWKAYDRALDAAEGC